MFIEFGVGILSLLLWEHLGTLGFISSYTPSVFLNWVGKQLGYFWSFLGRWFANISSYLLVLRFEKLTMTLENLFTSVLSILSSPWNFCSGYVKQAWTWVGYNGLKHAPDLIWSGSICLVLVITAVYMRYTNALSRWFGNVPENSRLAITDVIKFAEITFWDRVLFGVFVLVIVLGFWYLFSGGCKEDEDKNFPCNKDIDFSPVLTRKTETKNEPGTVRRKRKIEIKNENENE